MPKIGDGLDALTAFAGAAVAGMALFLPFTFSITGQSSMDSPYRVTSLVNSVPRAAALGLIVAVVIAVLVRPLTRPGLVWLTATAGAVALAINYLIGTQMTSTNVLTTQNYVDSLSGGVMYGALGICALRMRWPAVGFALGTVVVFVYGEVVAVFTSNTAAADKASHTPSWLVLAAVVLLAVNTSRRRHGTMLPITPRLAADLPISPIIAATVLSLSLLLATEWLSREFDGRRASTWQIGLAVAVTIGAAFLAAVLLPGRDGAGVLLAVSVAAAADSLGDTPSLGWNLILVLLIATAGILVALRRPTPWVVLLGAAAISVFAMFTQQLSWTVTWTIGTGLLAAVAGYGFAAVRVSYLPSAVLALGALYLPSVLWAIPTAFRNWPAGGVQAADSTPGRTALAITIGATAALLLLYRIRPADPVRVVATP
ncbi:hypothetical protein ACFO5K_17765 [Nocardia halotolerans]|uniref:Uncharacterized protein n=1 Tax=Nocardia halotolerans TaxID=1755878 RepID=A0ABV8VIS9_9NOCA